MSPLGKSKSRAPDLAIVFGKHPSDDDEEDEGGEDSEESEHAAIEALAEGLGIKPEDVDVEKVCKALRALHDLHTASEDDHEDEDEEEEET